MEEVAPVTGCRALGCGRGMLAAAASTGLPPSLACPRGPCQQVKPWAAARPSSVAWPPACLGRAGCMRAVQSRHPGREAAQRHACCQCMTAAPVQGVWRAGRATMCNMVSCQSSCYPDITSACRSEQGSCPLLMPHLPCIHSGACLGRHCITSNGLSIRCLSTVDARRLAAPEPAPRSKHLNLKVE
jgi:hypothetical protein